MFVLDNENNKFSGWEVMLESTQDGDEIHNYLTGTEKQAHRFEKMYTMIFDMSSESIEKLRQAISSNVSKTP